MLYDAFAAANVQGTGWYFERVSSTDDSDVEIPTIGPYREVDEDFDVDLAVREGTKMGYVVTAMETHFNRRDSNGNRLQSGGWDGYLTVKDERVSWYFASLFYAVKRRRMLALNVFSEGDDTFGTVELTAGPGMDFTDGVNYGNGSSLNKADGSNYAATQLRVVVTSMSSAKLDLRLGVKDQNDNPTTIDVTIPASSPAGTSVPVGTSSDRFLDLINVSFVPMGNFGTIGDTMTIRNLKERTIAL
jgi:hypothetical protein